MFLPVLLTEINKNLFHVKYFFSAFFNIYMKPEGIFFIF